MGFASLLEAWSSVLRAQNTTALEVQIEGASKDVTASVGTTEDKVAQDTRFVLEDQQTTGLSLLYFIVRYLWDVLTHRNIRTHHIYLPARFLRHLRDEAEAEFKRDHRVEGPTAPFVSDGDLITAWGSRMVLSSAPPKGSAVICNIFDLRSRLRHLKPSSTSRAAAYLQNLILPSVTLLTASEAQNINVSQIALRVRSAIEEQTSDAQVRGLMRLARTWFASLGMMPLFARWDTTRIIACTNWTKARLLDKADFGLATAVAYENIPASQALPVAYWGTTLAVHDNPRDVFVIYGKDHQGDYWVHAYLRQETWDRIVSEFHQYETKPLS